MADADPQKAPLEWDPYFAGIAEAVSKKSKDPNCPVGAVIVSSDRLVISTGFNGMARGIRDEADILGDKHKKLDWVVHAEHNAILNAARNGVSTQGCTLYVNKFPCFACLMVIVQAGIARLYTTDHEYWKNDPLDGPPHEGKRYVLRAAKLEIVAPNHPEYRLKLPELVKPGPGIRKASVPPPANEDSTPPPSQQPASASK